MKTKKFYKVMVAVNLTGRMKVSEISRFRKMTNAEKAIRILEKQLKPSKKNPIEFFILCEEVAE